MRKGKERRDRTRQRYPVELTESEIYLIGKWRGAAGAVLSGARQGVSKTTVFIGVFWIAFLVLKHTVWSEYWGDIDDMVVFWLGAIPLTLVFAAHIGVNIIDTGRDFLSSVKSVGTEYGAGSGRHIVQLTEDEVRTIAGIRCEYETESPNRANLYIMLAGVAGLMGLPFLISLLVSWGFPPFILSVLVIGYVGLWVVWALGTTALGIRKTVREGRHHRRISKDLTEQLMKGGPDAKVSTIER